MKNRYPVQGISETTKGISGTTKTAVINNELLRLQVDIATLQETRLAGSGTLKEKDYSFFCQGKSAEDRREHRVGFAVRNTLLKMVELGDKGSKCDDGHTGLHSAADSIMCYSIKCS